MCPLKTGRVQALASTRRTRGLVLCGGLHLLDLHHTTLGWLQWGWLKGPCGSQGIMLCAGWHLLEVPTSFWEGEG